MAFWVNPTREERPECIECGASMEHTSGLVCSATCSDLQLREFRREAEYEVEIEYA